MPGMRKNRLPKILVLVLLLFSCDKYEVSYVLDDFIQAGQTEGNGIAYTDLVPDINCTIVDPWVKTDTIIDLDLNNDGVDDFSIKRTMCHPSMLGGDCEDVIFIPLLNNEICVNPETGWLDTLSYHDSINDNNNWTNNEAMIYSFYWVIEYEPSTEGYWQNVKEINKNFIGVKIIKEEREFFGWIGMKSDTIFRSYDFYLTDYAILKEYPE